MPHVSADSSKRPSSLVNEKLLMAAQGGAVAEEEKTEEEKTASFQIQRRPSQRCWDSQHCCDSQQCCVYAVDAVDGTPRRLGTLSVNDSPKLSPLGDSEHDLCDDDTDISSLHEIDHSRCPAAAAAAGDEVALENDTRHLISSFLMDFAGVSSSQPRGRHQSKAHSTMKRVVEDLIEKHRYLYNGMPRKLKLDERGDDMSFMGSVAQEVFSDGTTTWGRIASLVAFGAVVCQHLMKEDGEPSVVGLVGQEISTYLLTDQRDWLVENKSWDGFVEFFRVSDPESTVRSTLLMAVAGFAGIGLTLALLIR